LDLVVLYFSHFTTTRGDLVDRTAHAHVRAALEPLASVSLPEKCIGEVLDHVWTTHPGRSVFVVVDEPNMRANDTWADWFVPGDAYRSPYKTPVQSDSATCSAARGGGCIGDEICFLAQKWEDIDEKYLRCYGPPYMGDQGEGLAPAPAPPEFFKTLQMHVQADASFLLQSFVPCWGNDLRTAADEVNTRLGTMLMTIPDAYAVNLVEVDFYPLTMSSRLFRSFLLANWNKHRGPTSGRQEEAAALRRWVDDAHDGVSWVKDSTWTACTIVFICVLVALFVHIMCKAKRILKI
jgi:hypothetical protein